jgi:hypothetical protein
MKNVSTFCLLAGLAALPASVRAQDPGQLPPSKDGMAGPGRHGPQDSLKSKAFQEGVRLRRDIAEKRRAYFDAVVAKKDEAAKKGELLAAMDRWNAFEKAQLEKAAQRFAKLPKDSSRELRHEVSRTRKAYFEAVRSKKDEAVTKAAYFSAIDKMVAYEKAHADETAARFARNPQGNRPFGPMRRPGMHRQGFGADFAPQCPRQGMSEGPMQGDASMSAGAPEGQPQAEMNMGPEDDMGPMADAGFDDLSGDFPEPQD